MRTRRRPQTASRGRVQSVRLLQLSRCQSWNVGLAGSGVSVIDTTGIFFPFARLTSPCTSGVELCLLKTSTLI